MNFIVTLLILILILGLIVVIHEFGHFIAAKRQGIFISEFSIGMGPKILSHKSKKDGIEYNLRLFPIGGFVSMANEEIEGTKLRKDQILENKSFPRKLLVLFMGILFNFILTIVLLFINALIYGAPELRPVVGLVQENSSAYNSGLKKDDLILSINNKKVSSWDDVILIIQYDKSTDSFDFEIERDNKKQVINIIPKVKVEDDKEVRTFGIGASTKKYYGFVSSLKYSFTGFGKMTSSLFNILGRLFTGKLGLDNLSGPIGVFNVIDQVKSSGFENLIYLTAYLSLNVGILNLIPIPVFDGGRILIVTIERLRRKKINPKFESYLNTAGFILLIILVIFVTLSDIIKLF
ncbi:MAG: RIP metalloprotease RseP [Bacilli bacterium]